jgi:hypothetical protein
MGPNRRAQERERATAPAADATKRAEAERQAAIEAQRVVARAAARSLPRAEPVRQRTTPFRSTGRSASGNATLPLGTIGHGQ